MNDPVTCGFLSDPFLHKRLLTAEELHGQLVIRRLEQGLKLILQEALLDLLTREARARFLLRRPIEGHVVHPEVDLPAALVIHLVACNTIVRGQQQLFRDFYRHSIALVKLRTRPINPSRVA